MRKKFTETDRQRYLAELKASGETPWSFARRIGITPANLYRWMRVQPGSTAPKFVQLVTARRSGGAAPVSAGRVSVQVGEATVQVELGFDATLLRAVVDALSSGAPS
jgi:transposase-like protein